MTIGKKITAGYALMLGAALALPPILERALALGERGAEKPLAREVTLTRGEAWFKVAHDKTRPFIVSAGRIRVRAVGTAFSVRRHDDGAGREPGGVAVDEGQVLQCQLRRVLVVAV